MFVGICCVWRCRPQKKKKKRNLQWRETDRELLGDQPKSLDLNRSLTRCHTRRFFRELPSKTHSSPCQQEAGDTGCQDRTHFWAARLWLRMWSWLSLACSSLSRCYPSQSRQEGSLSTTKKTRSPVYFEREGERQEMGKKEKRRRNKLSQWRAARYVQRVPSNP